MAIVHSFTFSPFAENTYIIYDDTKECVIIDPGCYTEEERAGLSKFIADKQLKPVRLLNTHCHIDHVFGNRYVSSTYNLGLEIHRGEIPVLESMPVVAQMYGIPNIQQSPDPTGFLEEGDIVKFGNTELSIFFSPGHSPASICFYSKKDGFVIGGDVLFQGSIGRTDLPGGDYPTLMKNIKEKFMTLPPETIVYSGHGPSTTIGQERRMNPFVIEYMGRP